jgi:tRNA(Ile)-lysidine synthase
VVEHARLGEHLLCERQRTRRITGKQRARRQRRRRLQVDRIGRRAQTRIIAVCDAVGMSGSVLEEVRRGAPLAAGERVLALVSGGRDSICLLDVLVAICGRDHLRALHVNYGLRGEESDGDERHVRAVCEELGVELVVCAAARPPQRGNLQAWARDLRYTRATQLAGPAELIATGHTASDQAETVLYRLAASPGRRALLGMSPREGRLVRPLLALTREQTTAHCTARGLSWREDSSNDGERFVRGLVRRGLLSDLRAIHPTAERNLLRSVEILRAEAAVLDELVRSTLGGARSVALTRLRELPRPLGRLLLIRLAEDAGGRAVPGAGARLEELLALGARGGSAALDLGAGVRAVVEYGVLRFEPARAARTPPATSLALPGSAAFGPWTLRGRIEDAAAAVAAAPRSAGLLAALDADALGGRPLAVRAARPGDRMRPLGLDGTRTLQDLFTDRRIPRSQRALTPVLECAGEIAWVPRVATAEAFRVAATTRRVALIEALRGA